MVRLSTLWPTRRGLARQMDLARIEQAIREAEARTSGEIRVSAAPLFFGSVEKMAERAFARLGMTRTREHNGVLLFVVPSRRRFVVLGDTGVHEKVGQAFWDTVAADLSNAFQRGDFTGGLIRAIGQVGEQLARHFPRQPEDVDELPDTVDLGGRAPEPHLLSP